MNTQGKSARLDNVLFYLIQAIVFLSPFFFIPSSYVPFELGKVAFIIIATLATFFIWTIARLKDGLFEVPKGLLYASGGIAVIFYALSAVLSPNKGVSLSGQFYEISTLGFFLVSFLLFALVPVVAKTKERLFSVYSAFFASAALIGIYQLMRLVFGVDFLSFGVLTSNTSNLVGKWNDLAIFFGLTALLSVITLERATLSKMLKYLVYVCLALSLIFIVVVGFSPVWITLSAFLVTFFIYSLSFKKETSNDGQSRKLPIIALCVLVLSLILSFGGQSVNTLTSKLGISQLEVRPSWGATLEIAKSTIAAHPIFGVGPNRFVSEWLLHKPDGINGTLFWNTNFNYGIGFIPSVMATSGILGVLSLLLFIGMFVWSGIKGIFSGSNDHFGSFLTLSSFLGALFMWVFAFIYVPSSSLWVLTMVLTGVFVGSLVQGGTLKTTRFSSLESPAKSFFTVLLTVLVLIAIAAFAYSVSIRALANVYFQKSLVTINKDGNLDQGEKYITEAISLSPNDSYYRFLAELYLVRVNNLLNDKNVTADEARTKFQNLLATAISAAQQATAYDATDYQNHLEAGRVFEAVVPLNISGAYDSAKKSYETALSLNPFNPEINLILARLEVANKAQDKAVEYIKKALALKSDYADAIFLLSQIEINQGKLDEAIKSLENVSILSPNDPGVFFQLGLLQYNQKDFKSSARSFGSAVTLNPQYANAKYFLGLSDYQNGDKEGALKQFQELKVTNPDNEEIKNILKNLEAGKSPLTNQPGVSPEKRTQAPVSDTKAASQSL